MPIETQGCNLYIDCDNDQLSSDQLFRMLVKDDSGCPSISVVGSGGGGIPVGLATEATLLDVVSGLDSMRDYEVRLIVDSLNVTWLEVRYWDAQDGALGAPVFYPPGSTVAGVPTGAVSYINPNTLLTQLLAELISIDVETKKLTVGKTPIKLYQTANATIPVGATEVSIMNLGVADITVNGGILPPGVEETYGMHNPIDTVINIVPAGEQFIATYMI